MARRKKSPDQKQVLSVRVAPHELAHYQKVAALRNMTLSDLIRGCLANMGMSPRTGLVSSQAAQR